MCAWSCRWEVTTVSTLSTLLIWIKACGGVTSILAVFYFKLSVERARLLLFVQTTESRSLILTLSRLSLALSGPDQHPSFSKSAIPLITTMMMRRLWEAGQQPGLGRWLLWWPSPRGGVERLWHWDDSGNGGGRSPGSNSTSKPSAGPSAGPAIHRWPTWHPGTTPFWPRPPGCPHWCVRRHAPPEDGVRGEGCTCEFKASLFQQPGGCLDNLAVEPEDVTKGTANCLPYFIQYGKFKMSHI